VTGIIGSGNNVRVLVNALMTDSRIKILSSPSVLATDNRPARIQVGTEEPVATGQVTGATGAATLSSSTTIQYRNTGRIVTIIPQVNSKGLVNLQTLVEVSQRGPLVQVGTSSDLFPSFDLRQAETTAVVQDGDTLAIGGMIADSRRSDRSGIPYLMDIPVVGRLFRNTTDDTRRTELIMLVTPHVIRNRSEGTAVTEEFKSRLSTLRNDLERMRLDRERDLEKMKREWQEQQKPMAPEPSNDAPVPSPSSGPALPEPPGAPVRNISGIPEHSPASQTSRYPRDSSGASTASLLVSRALPPQTVPSAGKMANPPEQNKEMSVALSGVVPKEHPRVPPVVANSMPEPHRPSSLWTVQVASFVQSGDAEGVAGKLKGKGYDAYVIAAEVKSRIWHRVRVGQGINHGQAVELRNALIASESFEDAYIAVR
jgi:cell division septation protein DedD